MGWAVATLVLLGLVLTSRPASAIPAFTRKYGTSCLTCHTVFPKLNPFGEAFRRIGFRFPGVDGNFTRQPVVPLGQPADWQAFPGAVWPGTLPIGVPVSLGFDGQAIVHPDPDSGARRTDNGANFTLQNLIAEGNLWAGGSFDNKTTFYGQITFSDRAQIEQARVDFNDLIGPRHVLNLAVGRMFAKLTSFGPHSSYVADLILTPLSVSALFGTMDPSWNISGTYNNLELNSILGGRFEIAAGVTSGANDTVRLSNNYYGHLGFKLGGMRLDGEGWTGPADPVRPWAERALTIDLFAYWTESHFTVPGGIFAPPLVLVDDRTFAYGGLARLQLDSLELDVGAYQELHDHVLADGGHVRGLVQFNEISYIVLPWLVPAVRFEYLRLSPEGGSRIHDLRIIPGIAILLRQNLKLTIRAQIEQANGVPPAQWIPARSFAYPPPGKSVTEWELIDGYLAFVF